MQQLGSKKKASVNPYKATITPTAVNNPARGVLTPDLDLRADLENEPVAGYAENTEPTVFVTPMAMSSWLGSIV